MSLGLSDKDIQKHYQSIVSGAETEWMVLSYDKGTNDLRVQATGDSGLEEMAEEFMESRIQYGFIRVKDPNTQLPKFVQINWCGEGAPDNRKGVFYSHSTAMSRYLQGSHLVINARNESDLDAGLIMKRVNDSSGSKYSVHNERAKVAQPIAPVGTAYTPIGQPDINALRASTKPKPPIASKAAALTSAASSGSGSAQLKQPIRPSPAPATFVAAHAVKTTTPDWDDEPALASKPVRPPASTAPVATPLVQVAPTAPAVKPAPAKLHISTDTKQPDDDGIFKPVGTNYVPVALPKPKKLVNPFAARQQEAAETAAAPSAPQRSAPAPTPGKKLTWSERQALAKKQQAEEEARSAAASNAGKAAVLGVAAATTGVGLAGAARFASQRQKQTEQPVEPEPSPPPPPPPPPAPPVSIAHAPPEPELEEVEYEAESEPPPPPPPPPPPAPAGPAAPAPAHVEPPTPTSSGAPKGTNGTVAIVLYAYEAAEENEISLAEGEYVEQIEEVDEGWWQGVAVSDKNRAGLFPANYVEVVESAEEPEIPPPPPPPPPPPAVSQAPAVVDEGTIAIAIYSYDASEDNEISFSEGDRITTITAASDDWWEGTAPNGKVGLFPANYVEVQE